MSDNINNTESELDNNEPMSQGLIGKAMSKIKAAASGHKKITQHQALKDDLDLDHSSSDEDIDSDYDSDSDYSYITDSDDEDYDVEEDLECAINLEISEEFMAAHNNKIDVYSFNKAMLKSSLKHIFLTVNHTKIDDKNFIEFRFSSALDQLQLEMLEQIIEHQEAQKLELPEIDNVAANEFTVVEQHSDDADDIAVGIKSYVPSAGPKIIVTKKLVNLISVAQPAIAQLGLNAGKSKHVSASWSCPIPCSFKYITVHVPVTAVGSRFSMVEGPDTLVTMAADSVEAGCNIIPIAEADVDYLQTGCHVKIKLDDNEIIDCGQLLFINTRDYEIEVEHAPTELVRQCAPILMEHHRITDIVLASPGAHKLLECSNSLCSSELRKLDAETELEFSLVPANGKKTGSVFIDIHYEY